MTRSRDVADTQDNLGGAVAPFVAGKNKIINGDFGVWQRGASFTSNGVYMADRWAGYWNGTPTLSISQQTFTPGSAPVAGYEGQYFCRLNVTTAGSGGSFLLIAQQRIEDVRTLAGQTATLSFWAKSDATRSVNVGIRQNFGSGGSAETYPTISGNPIITSTNWQRFTFQVSMSSISGKTIGTSSYVAVDIYATAQNITQTIDLWGVQLEAGSVATPFTPAGGGFPGAELALCQRYYERSYNLDMPSGTANSLGNGAIGNTGNTLSGNTAGNVGGFCVLPFKVTKRVAPTMVPYDYDGTANAVRVYPADSKRVGVTALANVQTSGAYQFMTFNNTSNVAINLNNTIMFHWTADAEL